MIYLFITSFIIIIYIYLAYPLLLFFLSKIVKKSVDKKEIYPKVSLIIAAYNEEKVIEKKILNSLEIDYPKGKLEIIVFSDGSTDKTDAIVKSYKNKGIKLFRYEGRKGKTYCQNESVKKAKGEIIVFSDANSIYDKLAIKNLVYNFNDELVGVVCGNLKYIKNNKNQEGLYWKLENFLKKKESSIKSCLGANGSIYALRKELYVNLNLDVISDFIEPFLIYKQGFRVIYDDKAFCFENLDDNRAEFNRKRRIILRSWQSLKYIKDFLNPFKYGLYSIFLLSHKLFRWLVFFFLILLFISNLFLLDILIFRIIFYLQLIFYILSLSNLKSKNKILSIINYFCLINYASMLAFIDFLKGKKKLTWEVKR